jgi:hypothetical protein
VDVRHYRRRMMGEGAWTVFDRRHASIEAHALSA